MSFPAEFHTNRIKQIQEQISGCFFSAVSATINTLRSDHLMEKSGEQHSLFEQCGIAVGKGLETLCADGMASQAVLCLGEIRKHTEVRNAIPYALIPRILLALPKDSSRTMRVICVAEAITSCSPQHHAAYIEGFAQLPADTQTAALASADKLCTRETYKLMSGQSVVGSGPPPLRVIAPKI